MNTIDNLQAVLEELQRRREQIEVSGPIAPSYVWVDLYSVKGVQYARLKSDRPILDGKKYRGLGRIGSERHCEWDARCKRRNAIQEIERRALLIEKMIDLELHSPIEAA